MSFGLNIEWLHAGLIQKIGGGEYRQFLGGVHMLEAKIYIEKHKKNNSKQKKLGGVSSPNWGGGGSTPSVKLYKYHWLHACNHNYSKDNMWFNSWI